MSSDVERRRRKKISRRNGRAPRDTGSRNSDWTDDWTGGNNRCLRRHGFDTLVIRRTETGQISNQVEPEPKMEIRLVKNSPVNRYNVITDPVGTVSTSLLPRQRDPSLLRTPPGTDVDGVRYQYVIQEYLFKNLKVFTPVNHFQDT